jgi:hypothetical protein
MAQDSGAVAAAEDALRAFQRDNPRSVLMPHVDERLATIMLRRVDAAIAALDPRAQRGHGPHRRRDPGVGARQNVRTITPIDGDSFCVYSVESGPSI